MIKFKFFFIFLFISLKCFSNNIAVIDIDYILNNNNDYINFIEKLNSYKVKFENNIKIYENDLLKLQKEIDELNTILSKDELTSKYDKYNNDLIAVKSKIDDFNFFINSNIDENRFLLIKEINQIVKNIATINQYDLILNENNYFISSEKLDISDIVIKELNNIKINLYINNNDDIYYK